MSCHLDGVLDTPEAGCHFGVVLVDIEGLGSGEELFGVREAMLEASRGSIYSLFSRAPPFLVMVGSISRVDFLDVQSAVGNGCEDWITWNWPTRTSA